MGTIWSCHTSIMPSVLLFLHSCVLVLPGISHCPTIDTMIGPRLTETDARCGDGRLPDRPMSGSQVAVNS